MKHVDGYFQFLTSLEKSNKKYGLSNDERLLLDIVATSTHAGTVTYVKDILGLREIASQATLHKALTSLVEKKLLVLQSSHKDGRLKEVQLTKLANRRYDELSSAIARAIKQ